MFRKKIDLFIAALIVTLVILVLCWGYNTDWKFHCTSDPVPAVLCVPKCTGVACGGSNGCGGKCTAPANCPCTKTCGTGDKCGAADGCGGICGCINKAAKCVGGKCIVPVPVPAMSVSSDTFKSAISPGQEFDAAQIYSALAIGPGLALLHYVAIEYEQSKWPAQVLGKSECPTTKDILSWFWQTLDKCQADDCLIIHGDFLSFDSSVTDKIADKINGGMKFIILVDRWEISGAPLFDSAQGKPWSPNPSVSNGCPTCDNTGCDVDKYPYICCGSIAGTNKAGYCRDTNTALIAFQNNVTKKENLFMMDMATTKLVWGSSSRQTPLHNHRHMTTFYLKSQGIASIFKGSWNFTGGNPDNWGASQLPGQKESGIVLTAQLTSPAIQSDIMTNYYWLTVCSIFIPSDSVKPPESFTAPGVSSALFQYLLKLINPENIDATKDEFIYDTAKSTTYEVYSVVRHNGSIYLCGDPQCNITMSISPPPANSQPPATMLARQLNDGGSVVAFSDIWPVLSQLSFTNTFLYPFAPTYKNNPVLPAKWRVPAITGSACSAVTGNDVGSACLVQDSMAGGLIPSNGCYTLDGDPKKYKCSGTVPWAPGATWIGEALYNFWKDAEDVYVNMYSAIVDSGTGCILNCNRGMGGGVSGWSGSLITSDQYSGKAAAINSGTWFSTADSNSIQNVLDFLQKKNAKLFIVAGQWKNINPGLPNGALDLFYNQAQKSGSSINYKLYQAQTKQTTLTGAGDTAKTVLDSTNNPDAGNNWQRNHTKCYLSKRSVLVCSGHPYNGGVNDWAGVNEAMYVENCPNFLMVLRANFETEYQYANTIKNSGTFPFGAPWLASNVPSLAEEIVATTLSEVLWSAGGSGGLIKI